MGGGRWGQALASAVKGPVSYGFLALSPAEISEAASECRLEREVSSVPRIPPPRLQGQQPWNPAASGQAASSLDVQRLSGHTQGSGSTAVPGSLLPAAGLWPTYQYRLFPGQLLEARLLPGDEEAGITSRSWGLTPNSSWPTRDGGNLIHNIQKQGPGVDPKQLRGHWPQTGSPSPQRQP